MKQRKKRIIVGLIVILLLAGGIIAAVYFTQKTSNKSSSKNDKPNQNPPENPGNDSKKNLTDKIKNDLQVRLERVKNGSHELEDMMPYIIDGNPKRTIMCNVDGLKFIKWGESISFDDIGEENAQSIINLVKQIRTAKEEWKEKKWQEAQEKADADSNLFYFPGKGNFTGELARDEIDHFQFYSRQDKKDYRLTIPVLHPDLANVKIKSEDWNLYRITGVENIPLVPCPIETVKVPYKIVKLSDHFTIEKIYCNDNKNNLAKEIKEQITAELEQIKKAKTTDEVDEILVFGYKVGPQGAILRSDNQKKVLPTELETADYQEIVNLISQEKQELARNKTIELRKEIAEKLASRPNLFYYPIQISKTAKLTDWWAWSFFAKKNGQDYFLKILRDHPAITNVAFKDCQFYQITGVENLPLIVTEEQQPYKIVKPENQITIKLIEN